MWGESLRVRGNGRGQTVLDFAIGMSVFLLAVGFVFSFVPSLLEPFSADEGARMIVAERGAAHLTETSLSAGSTPGVLSAACTVGFFDGAEPSEEECSWTHDADALEDEIGADRFTSVNVRITRNGSVSERDGVELSAGHDPPPRASISTASRMVDLDGETHRLTVRVW